MNNAIWDFDGTLYDSYPGMLKALLEIFAQHGLTLNPEQTLVAIKRNSIRQLMTELAPKVGADATELEAAFHRQEAQYLPMAKPYPQTAQTLKAMADQGNQHLLMTHRDHTAWELLQRDGLAGYFLGGVDSELNLPRKPDPAAINYLMDRFQLNPAMTAMIGDRRLDVVAGQRAHVKGIYLNIDGLNDAPQADFVVNQLQAIPSLFNRK